MVWVACMCTLPGGSIIKNLISPAVIILNMAVDSDMPLYGFNWGIENLNGNYKVKGKQKEAGGYGASLKEDYRYFFGAHVGMAGRGEAIAREDSLLRNRSECG